MKRESVPVLHTIVDDFERHVKILGQLGEPVNSWSTILEHILCTRLHDDTLKAWEDHASTLDAVTYERLIEFLQRRIRVLESISVNKHYSSVPAETQFKPPCSKRSFPTKVSSHAAVENSPMKCYTCDQRHPLVKCYKFEKLPISEKLNLLNAKRLCLNCFRNDHPARNCSSKASVQTNVATAEAVPLLSASTLVKSQEQVCSIPMQSCGRNGFMLTVLLKIVDCYGEEHFARALLDCASQPNIISKNLAQILRLKRNKVNVLIHGVGEKPQHARNSVRTQVRSRKGEFILDVDFLVLNKVIPNLPTRDVSIEDWNLPQDLFYADPNYHKSSGIDLIIGNEHFFSCFKTAARIQLSDSLPFLVDSVFGWIVSGTAHAATNAHDASTCSVTTVSLMSLEESLERFWEIEEPPARSAYSLEEKKCEEFYTSTVTRNSAGRYVVRLPRKSNFDELVGESKATEGYDYSNFLNAGLIDMPT
ncbi:uncharacterized protein LOC135714655 [Ochlerotatus camptorhynchus]|uniref:uncharacterized protein LOC135714655 n=1 Tax=Ochlerotatus camptorhynchus TaxID=644619 RepID=UPI0031D1EF44